MTAGYILYPLVALVAWAGAANVLNRILNPPIRAGGAASTSGRREVDRGLVGMFVAMVGLAMTFTLSTPFIWLQVDRILHVPNIATLISQMFVLVYTAGQEVMLLYWLYPLEKKARRHVRIRVIALSLIVPVMAVLFLAAGTEARRVEDFVAHYAGLPAVSLYLSLYLAGFAAGQLDVLRLATKKYAPICSDKALRRGLRTVSAGAVLGLVYVAARAADIAAGAFGWNPYAWELAAQLSAGIGAILVIVGLNLPGWASAATLCVGISSCVRCGTWSRTTQEAAH